MESHFSAAMRSAPFKLSGAGRFFLVVEGGYRGEVALSFSPQAEICDDAAILAQDEDVDIELEQQPGHRSGLSRGAAGQALYRFTVDEPSMVTLAIDSDDVRNAVFAAYAIRG